MLKKFLAHKKMAQDGEDIPSPPETAPDVSKIPVNTEISVFDKAELLVRINHNISLLHKLVKVFLDTVPGDIKHLQTLLLGDQPEPIKSQVHKMKGYFSSISANALWKIAVDMETAAGRNDIERCRSLFGQIQDGFDAFKQEVTDNSS